MGCEMAERSVVASKSEPMKAGNRPEDNAWMSMRGSFFYKTEGLVKPVA
ncbi:MAG: hypothetical protein WD469_10375 [Paenibacillaceae bacterium]